MGDTITYNTCLEEKYSSGFDKVQLKNRAIQDNFIKN